MNPQRKRYFFIAIGLLNIVIAFSLGYFVATARGIHTAVVNKNGDVEITKVLDLYSKSRSSSADFDQFWKVWDMVKKSYVHQPVDDVKLFYGALQGMVAGLEDPYSVYFPPKKAEEFATDLAGEFEGIGADIGIKDNIITIISPLADSPAQKAGIKSGDKIYAIDKTDATHLTVEEAIQKIRGPHGTEVTLTVSQKGPEASHDIKIIRDKIVIPAVTWEKKEKNIAYIRINVFNEETRPQFQKAVNEIKTFGAKGIVLDMRGNPGGYLDTSVLVASEWVKEGVIVRERFNDKTVKEYPTMEGLHSFVGIPTIVLVDEGTASGAEIVAGALQDYGAAKLVGKKTFGKGSVQDLQPLPDGSALKLTIANWFTPKDRAIDKQGIEPDILVDPLFKENQKAAQGYDDLGIQKAIQLLSEKK